MLIYITNLARAWGAGLGLIGIVAAVVTASSGLPSEVAAQTPALPAHRDSGFSGQPPSRLGGPVAPGDVIPAPRPMLPSLGLIIGRANVVDGDTLEIRGLRIRLEGIDAPESGQGCGRSWIGQWSCGTTASSHLARLVADKEVTCENRGLDKYGRTLAICFVDGRDINAQMVEDGLAWAFVKYSRAYVAQEERARAARRGIWVGHAVPAWEYRAQKWGTAETRQAEAPSGCVIKGSVTKNGRIYHMPWSPWYDKIKIDADPAKRGERRWFCTEAEALAAGWRPVR